MHTRVSGRYARASFLTAIGFGSLATYACASDTPSSTGAAPVNQAGAAGADAGTGAGGSSGGTGGVPTACDASAPAYPPRADNAVPGGYVKCENGVVHRPSKAACWSSLEADAGCAAIPADGGPGDAAAPDAHDAAAVLDFGCVNGSFMHCTTYPLTPLPGTATSCERACVVDADCPSEGGYDYVCLCDEPMGRCVIADCKEDADCAPGSQCAIKTDLNPCGAPARSSMVCTKAGQSPNWTGAGGVCGRPFLVDGSARLAPVTARSDWTAPAYFDVGALSSETRRNLAAHWTEIGLMEHASVAAFARFVLQLMSLGAPADLVDAASAAMRDETEHTRLAFGMVEKYAGLAVGPGPLSSDGALHGNSLDEIVRTAFLEACVGETTAALEAAEAATYAEDPAVADVLERIAEDETRHGELGWRFMKWAVASMDPVQRAALEWDLERAVAEAVRAALRAPVEEPLWPRDAALLRHGVLPRALENAIRRKALLEVVVPCLRALFRRDNGEIAATPLEQIASRA